MYGYVSPQHGYVNCVTLWRILKIKWQEKVLNTDVLQRTGTPSSSTDACDGSNISSVWTTDESPKTYSTASWHKEHAQQEGSSYKDVCKRDLKALGIGLKTWETLASERSSWKSTAHNGLTHHEQTMQQSIARRQRRKTRYITSDGAATEHICMQCRTDCHSQIGQKIVQDDALERKLHSLARLTETHEIEVWKIWFISRNRYNDASELVWYGLSNVVYLEYIVSLLIVFIRWGGLSISTSPLASMIYILEIYPNYIR
jgi:hypothetical protein